MWRCAGAYRRIFDFTPRGRRPGMAFIDMGDQFINLSKKRTQSPDQMCHSAWWWMIGRRSEAP
jgi:hypothetical protein